MANTKKNDEKKVEAKPKTKTNKQTSKTTKKQTTKKTSTSKQSPARKKKSAPETTGVLFTGFPGFIGRRLIKKMLSVWPESTWYLIVLPKMEEIAKREISAIEAEMPDVAGRLKIVLGDITKPGLGIEPKMAEEIRQNTLYAFHLAAIYHLSVPKEIAYKVNVEGTINFMDFLEECPNFKRFIYFSTCYVAGTRMGLIKEDELEAGQSFKNYYEETKFYAEKEVRARMDHIPTVIIRPAIVIGDSKTGETDKYDGPYYLFKLFKQIPSFIPVPKVGKMIAYVNIVPIDYIIDGTVALAQHPKAVGKTFQLADPRPLTAEEIYRAVAKRFGIKVLPISVPDEPIKWIIDKFPQLGELIGLPAEVLDYFSFDARFDTTNARTFLEPLSVHCPYLLDYLDVIIEFFNAHPEIQSPKPTGDN